MARGWRCPPLLDRWRGQIVAQCVDAARRGLACGVGAGSSVGLDRAGEAEAELRTALEQAPPARGRRGLFVTRATIHRSQIVHPKLDAEVVLERPELDATHLPARATVFAALHHEV